MTRLNSNSDDRGGGGSGCTVDDDSGDIPAAPANSTPATSRQGSAQAGRPISEVAAEELNSGSPAARLTSRLDHVMTGGSFSLCCRTTPRRPASTLQHDATAPCNRCTRPPALPSTSLCHAQDARPARRRPPVDEVADRLDRHSGKSGIQKSKHMCRKSFLPRGTESL